MDANRWKKIEEIYDRALDLGGEERESFIAEACGDDGNLRREIELLLAAHEDAGSFLEAPAVEVAAREIVGDEDTSPAPQLIGRELANYKIISLLGKGGMGEVYLAEDKRLHRKVALKLLPTQFTNDAERVRRFEREASAASATNHPNIITIHEIGQASTEEGGAHYIVTEFIDGQTLRQRIQTAKLSLNEVVDVAIQVAQALEAAHSAGIVHRDIKPENVMVRRDGLVKVLDFGLAKLTEVAGVKVDSEAATLKKADTAPGMVMGTPQYMSPEQARGEELDARTDLFSFGAMLYEMATGSAPFKGDSIAVIFDAILNREPVPPTQLNPKAPAELEHIIGKALEKDRDLRCQSAKEMLADLKRLQRDVSSGRPAAQASAPTAAKPPARWRKWAVIAAVPVVIIAALLIWKLKPSSDGPPKVLSYTAITTDGNAKAVGVFDQPIASMRLSLVTDGPRLYFSAMVNGQTVLNQVSGAGGETVTLSAPFQNSNLLDLSPNRSEFLLVDLIPSDSEAQLWALPLLGGSPRRLGDVRAHAASWSPNGQQIVYANGSDFFVANNDGTGARKLLTAAGRPYWPRWSPDGSRLRFTVLDTQTNATSLWEVNADGSNPHPLLPGWNTPAAECCGNWTADGRHFVFQSTRNQTASIWSLSGQAGREPAQLTIGPLSFRAPVPSADGRRLYAVGEQRRGELIRYDKRTEQWVSHLSGMSAQGVNFSKDGEWITYVSYPDGNLWRSRVDGSQRLQLSFPPTRIHSPRWSPDGKRIAFIAALPGKLWKIHLVSADGGAPKQLMPEERVERDPVWSPDGGTLAFCIGATGTADKRTINLLDLRTGQVSLLPGSDGKYSPRWSPDGRYLAAMLINAQKLLLFDFTTKQWTELASMNISFPQWSRDGQYLYFLNLNRSDPALLRVRISDRKIEQWASMKDLRIAPSAFGRWMGLAPDDSPMMMRDVGAQDIYALEWQVP
ncbi:MAG: Serine/threonine-protein kinase PknD [Acidobacteria bacterium]|nr:Serine/threonine-protein kinase PknD [Acidobacteriota bacterium]